VKTAAIETTSALNPDVQAIKTIKQTKTAPPFPKNVNKIIWIKEQTYPLVLEQRKETEVLVQFDLPS